MTASSAYKSICVFCGSNSGAKSEYAAAAQALGRAFASRGIITVYGGGCRGLMGTLADAALEAGGQVFGVMPQSLVDMEVAHTGLTRMNIVTTMHERKALMNSLADAFVILPGGWGTMDEFCEVLTWAQLQIHHKPIAIWNVLGYYDAFLAFADHAASEGLLKAKDRQRLLVATNLDELFAALDGFVPVYEAIPSKVRD